MQEAGGARTSKVKRSPKPLMQGRGHGRHSGKIKPVEVRKRFSIRHGMEAEPSAPVFEDAPKRLRFFVLEALQRFIAPRVALKVVGRTLCLPKLLTSLDTVPVLVWREIGPFVNGCEPADVYNLIEAMWAHLVPTGLHRQFAEDLNRVFGEESIGWKLDDNGLLQRTLPAAVQIQVEQIFRELEAPRFAPALVQVRSAYKAYNGHPRVDLDVCMNIFDALESVAKEVFSMPSGTLGDVLKKAKGTFSPGTISTLEKLGALASNHFRHGMTEPFKLTPAETDFVYVTCLAGMMLFVRSVPR